MGWEKRRIGELVDHYHYSVAFGERWMDGWIYAPQYLSE